MCCITLWGRITKKEVRRRISPEKIGSLGRLGKDQMTGAISGSVLAVDVDVNGSNPSLGRARIFPTLKAFSGP